MILDERTEFCDATALNTGGAGTYNLGDVIPLSVARDIGQQNHIYLVINVAVAIAAGASGTLQFRLVSDTSEPPNTSTATVHYTSTVFDSASGIAAGTNLVRVKLPWEDPDYETFLGIQQITGVAAVSAGAIDAFLTLVPAAWKAYPEGQN